MSNERPVSRLWGQTPTGATPYRGRTTVKPPLVERPREKRGQTPIRTALRLSIVVWIVYAVTAGGSLATADAVAMLEQAKSIVDRGALDIPAVWSLEEWRGRDGRYYSPFGIAQSVYDIPWLLTGRSIPKVIGRRLPDPDALAKALVAFGNSFVTAAAVGFAFLLAVSISNDRRASVAAALVLAFGTLLWPYSKYGFNAPLVTLGLTVGAYGFVAGTMTASVPTLLLGGVGFGLALLTRHEMILASVVGIVWLMTEARQQRLDRRHVAAASVAIAAALIIWAVLNVVRFGNPFRTGHHPSFSFGGFLGFSISPWGALLLYSPIAAAGLVITWRNRRYGVVSSPSCPCSGPRNLLRVARRLAGYAFVRPALSRSAASPDDGAAGRMVRNSALAGGDDDCGRTLRGERPRSTAAGAGRNLP